jgi:hypothetical protein
VERKVAQYIECAEGDIQAAIILDVQYPKANRAKVALRVADGTTTGTWVRYFDTIYDDNLTEQPEGEVGLYLSDFIGPAGLPAAFCRPSAAETAADVQRFVSQLFFLFLFYRKLRPHSDPQVHLSYERLRKIFLKARAIYQGTYGLGDGEKQEEDNIYTILLSIARDREQIKQAQERTKQAQEQIKQAQERTKQAQERAERERERAERAQERERELNQQIAKLQAHARQL